MNRFATIAGGTHHLADNRQKETNGHCHSYAQQCPLVLHLKLPQLNTRGWVVLNALRVALAARKPPRDAEHGYTKSSQNDPENDTEEAGNHRPSGNNL